MVLNEKVITWEESKAISEQLATAMVPINEENLKVIASGSGLVAWYYSGEELGFGLSRVTEPQMIYVGRGGENVTRHFTNGKTYLSTIRRSLCALLFDKYSLQPKAGPQTLEDTLFTDKYYNFDLDEASDDRLTRWIASNICIAYVPLHQDKVEASLQGLINYNVPIFNLQNNPDNKYGAEIKIWRKKCSDIAATADAAE